MKKTRQDENLKRLLTNFKSKKNEKSYNNIKPITSSSFYKL